MNRYIVLTRVMLKNFDLLSMKEDKNRKNKIKKVLFTLLLAVAFLPIMIGIGTMAFSGYGLLAQVQQEGLILGTGFSAACMVVFFFSIFYVLSVFYFSKDIESLLPLPFKPSEILAAKFTVTLLYEYLTGFIFLAPIFVGYGAASHAGAAYYLYSILIFLALPVLPLVYASLLSMVVMRFTNIGRNRDKFRIVGGIIVMFLAIGLNAAATKLGSASMSAEELQRMLAQGNNSAVSLMSGIFFSNRFAVMALLHSNTVKGIVNMAVFILVSVLFVMLFLNFGEGMYFKGVIGISEAGSKRKRYTRKELEKSTVQKPALNSLVLMELRLLFRTPAYFMNCMLMNFIWPVFIVIPFIVQPSEMEELKGLSAYISGGSGNGIVLAAAFGISVFIAATNGITASAISRHGSGIYISKYLPVSYKTQIMAKVLSGIVMGMVGTFSMIILGLFFVRLPLVLLFMTAVDCLLGIAFSSMIGMLLDLNFPKLVWDNEQKAVKQNFNVVLNMLISAVIAGIPVFITIVLQFTMWMAFIIFTVLFGILNLLLYNILSTVGVRLFGRIEV